jgi:hypothetical protein
MAFKTNLIALKWFNGTYSVHSFITGHIQVGKLEQEKRLFDVTNEMTYMDEACVLSRREFPEYLLKEENFSGAENTRVWFQRLPSDVQFIMVHVAEWESGLGDS